MGISDFYIRSLKHRVLYLAGAVLFGLFLLYLCTRPHSAIERWHYPDISDLFDAMNHFIGFSIFNFLLISAFLAGRTNRPSPQYRCPAALLLAVGIPWGLLCELSQLLIPSRSFQFLDIAANTLPSLFVFCIFKMMVAKESSYKKL